MNQEINELLDGLALRMGTSKRNVILLALTNILKHDISRDDLEEMKKNVHQLTFATNITINDTLKDRLMRLERYGLSVRKFFGYVICSYFYKHYSDFLKEEETVNEQLALHQTKKIVVQPSIDVELKKRLTTYCEQNSIAVSSLFSHYIMNKDIRLIDFNPGNKEFLNLTLSVDVHKRLSELAEDQGMSKNFYLNLIAVQISDDLNL